MRFNGEKGGYFLFPSCECMHLFTRVNIATSVCCRRGKRGCGVISETRRSLMASRGTSVHLPFETSKLEKRMSE